MRSRVVAVIIGMLAALVPLAPTPTPVAALVDGASAYTPLTPARAADTRPDYGAYGFTRISPTLIRVKITGRADLPGVPATASAVVLNIASDRSIAPGFVTAYPTGTAMPLASSLNIDQVGRVINNMATVRLGVDGWVDLYTNVPMDLVIDVAGVYVPVKSAVSAGRLHTIPGGAQRALDTRDRGVPIARDSSEFVDLSAIGIPADATAVVVNLAATLAAPGFWTAYPVGVARPTAASLNIDQPMQTRNAQGIIALTPGPRGFEIYSMGGGHLIVDVVGWFTGAASPPSEDGLFVPTAPRRALDTRPGRTMPLWGASTVEFSPLSPFPDRTAAVAMNIAIAEPLYLGYITVYPAGVPRPWAANLNVTAFDQIIANHGISRTGTRGVAVFTQAGAHIIVDVTGWYLGAPEPSTLPLEPLPSFGPTWAVRVRAPTAGINAPVGYGPDPKRVADTGAAVLWAGYGLLGVPDTNIYFAHRTNAGGPFRSIDKLLPGQAFHLVGADDHVYVYLVIRKEIILPDPMGLIDLALEAGPVTATLVACHPPGSTRYRIVVTGRLIAAV